MLERGICESSFCIVAWLSISIYIYIQTHLLSARRTCKLSADHCSGDAQLAPWFRTNCAELFNFLPLNWSNFHCIFILRNVIEECIIRICNSLHITNRHTMFFIVAIYTYGRLSSDQTNFSHNYTPSQLLVSTNSFSIPQ